MAYSTRRRIRQESLKKNWAKLILDRRRLQENIWRFFRSKCVAVCLQIKEAVFASLHAKCGSEKLRRRSWRKTEFCEVVPSGGVRWFRTQNITVYKIPCHNSDCYGKLLKLVCHVIWMQPKTPKLFWHHKSFPVRKKYSDTSV